MEARRLVRTDSPGRPPRLSHSSWTMVLSCVMLRFWAVWCWGFELHVMLRFWAPCDVEVLSSMWCGVPWDVEDLSSMWCRGCECWLCVWPCRLCCTMTGQCWRTTTRRQPGLYCSTTPRTISSQAWRLPSSNASAFSSSRPSWPQTWSDTLKYWQSLMQRCVKCSSVFVSSFFLFFFCVCVVLSLLFLLLLFFIFFFMGEHCVLKRASFSLVLGLHKFTMKGRVSKSGLLLGMVFLCRGLWLYLHWL